MTFKGFGLFFIFSFYTFLSAQLALAAEFKVGKKKDRSETTIDLHVVAPPLGPPPGGYFYDGPHQGYYGYPPFVPYGWTPPYSSYPSIPEGSNGEKLIPAGRLMILVDPVSAEVYVDGLHLRPNADLSYEVGLLEGSHLVEVKAGGYRSYKKEMDIQGGKRIILTIRLDRK